MSVVDPNACLNDIRVLVRAILAAEDEQRDTHYFVVALTENVAALDSWLERGGFLPAAWGERVSETEKRDAVV